MLYCSRREFHPEGRRMEISDVKYSQYLQILREELLPAMGCTEPIAMAYAAAKARQTLGEMPSGYEPNLRINTIITPIPTANIICPFAVMGDVV